MRPAILLVGYSSANTEQLARTIQQEFPGTFEVIRTLSVHEFLNTQLPLVFGDDNTVTGYAYELRQQVTTQIRGILLSAILRVPDPPGIIYQAANLTHKDRKSRLDNVRILQKDMPTVIIWLKMPEGEIVRQAENADRELVAQNAQPTWVDLYYQQKERFEPPTQDEADHLLIAHDPWVLPTALRQLKQIIDEGMSQS